MNKCKECGNEHEKRGKYCSGACKQIAYRNKSTEQTVTSVTPEVVETVTSVTVEQTVTAYGYEIIEGEKVYGRKAVRYPDQEAWSSRPEPIHFLDIPKPLNRGKYIRPDGSEYQFDAIGQVFECADGEVYPTMAALKQAQAENNAPVRIIEHGKRSDEKFYAGKLSEPVAMPASTQNAPEPAATGQTQEKGSNHA